MALKSDPELVEDFKHGKVEGFNELVRRYQQKVYWVARRLVGNHHDADDVTQEVFVRVYRSLKDFRGEANFYTWVYRITTNVALNALRRRKLREFVRFEDAPALLEDSGNDPAEGLDKKEYAQAVERAVDRLPPKQRIVFMMRFYEELSYEEIAKILNRSVGGLKANYFHAVKKIQSYVKKDLEGEM